MQVTRAIVPAAGMGTRLYPVTKSQPKEMLPLGTRPVIQGVAEEAVAAGISDMLIITGTGKGAIEEHFDPEAGLSPEEAPENGPPAIDPSSIQFYYTRQAEKRGLGDAISYGAKFASGEHFAVLLGDCVIEGTEAGGPLKRLVEAHIAHEAQISIVLQYVDLEATRRYGIIAPGPILDEDIFEMADIVEKPGPQETPGRFAVAARYVFSPVLFEYITGLAPGVGGEIQLTDAIRAMLRDGHRGIGVPLREGERRLDVGNFESYSRAFFRAMICDESYGEDLRGYAKKLLVHLDDPSQADPDIVER